jgi:hypothetical protein
MVTLKPPNLANGNLSSLLKMLSHLLVKRVLTLSTMFPKLVLLLPCGFSCL